MIGKRNMSLSRKSVVLFALILAASVLATSMVGAQDKGSPAKALRIGSLLSLSDWYSVFDGVENRYLTAAAKMINERGGITVQGQRYNIELVVEDGKSTMDGVTAAATKLAFDDKVKFVVGPSAYFNAAVSPVFEPNKVLHVLGYYTAQPGEMDANTPYAFLGYNASIGNSLMAVKALRKEYPNVKKIVIATPDDGTVPYIIPKVKAMAESAGLTVVGDTIKFPNQMEDFSPISVRINSVKDAEGVLIVHGAPPAFGLIIKGLRSLGNKKPISINGNTSIEELVAVAGKDAVNGVVSVCFTPGNKSNPPLFKELYQKAGNKPPVGVNTSEDLWVLTRMIQAANSLDPTVVKAKWESTNTVDTLFGKGIVSGDQTYGVKHHAVSHPMSYEGLINGKTIYGDWLELGRMP